MFGVGDIYAEIDMELKLKTIVVNEIGFPRITIDLSLC